MGLTLVARIFLPSGEKVKVKRDQLIEGKSGASCLGRLRLRGIG